MNVSRVSEMRSLDKAAIEEFGIPEELLMENAGQAVYSALLEAFGVEQKRYVVFCGTGNNGGDGLVVARKLHSSRAMVTVFVLGDPGGFRGAAATNMEIASRLPIEVRQVGSADEARAAVDSCDCIVDALFGTGLTREVTGLYRDVIELINASGKKVCSVDIPSGVDGDTGQVRGIAVRADVTVTFGLPKIGNMLYPGYELGGSLYVSHISFPPDLYDAERLRVFISGPIALLRRDADGHKGTFGQALFIAGAAGYYGAPYLSALSFLRAGGGYSRLAAPRSIVPFIGSKGSEIVFVPQAETGAGSLALSNKRDLLDLSARMDVVVLGPGLSLESETQDLVRELAREIDRPLVIDGDGITAVCQDLGTIRARTDATVLTPHLGEMSRLTGLDVDKISAHKIDVLQRTADELRAVIVLKGAHSLIGYPDGRVAINMSGNSGMATAGSGDVLTGAIAAMYGLGLSVDDAVRKGVFIHGFAGDLAAERVGKDGMTAQDVLDYLPLAMKIDRQGLEEPYVTRYAGVRVI